MTQYRFITLRLRTLSATGMPIQKLTKLVFADCNPKYASPSKNYGHHKNNLTLHLLMKSISSACMPSAISMLLTDNDWQTSDRNNLPYLNLAYVEQYSRSIAGSQMNADQITKFPLMSLIFIFVLNEQKGLM